MANDLTEGNGRREYGQYLQKVDDIKDDISRISEEIKEIKTETKSLIIIKESGCPNLLRLQNKVDSVWDGFHELKTKWAIIAGFVMFFIATLSTLIGNYLSKIL